LGSRPHTCIITTIIIVDSFGYSSRWLRIVPAINNQQSALNGWADEQNAYSL
jgi:hypothetical protein